MEKKSGLEIEYQIEPIKNIALARNKAVNLSKGEYIAFIDDDEFPEKDWLRQLFESCSIYDADGVLGPVIPHYVCNVPKWISLGEPIDRRSFKTGTILTNPKYTRTGNVLLSRRLFKGDTIPFAPEYGRTGGEDVDFFKRKIRNQFKFIWCDEAPIFEFVTKERLSRLYHLKRALIRGQVNYQQASFKEKIIGINKSIIASIIYILSLPIMFILGHHLFMKYLIKSFNHIGMIISVFGINKIER